MANDRSMERLERLRETPLYKVSESGINWYAEPTRAEIANQMTWLGLTDHDAPIRKAFKFFSLDEADPRHWRILTTYLAMGFFPNPKKDGKPSLKTHLANDALLKRVNAIRNSEEGRGLRDTDILKLIVKAHPKDYPRAKLANLRKRLKAARKAAGYFLK
jgi:hypothetical protein